MGGYIKQAELIGEWRSVWSRHVWWTREVMLSILNSLPSTIQSVNKLLENPGEMGKLFSEFYSPAQVRQIEDLFTTHLKMGGDIMTAAKAGDMAKVEDLTRQWYANADDIARTLNSYNPRHYHYEDVKDMMYEHLRLTLIEVSSYLQGDYNKSITTFDQIQAEAQKMGDYFAQGLIAQFPNAFR